jgi:aspartate-semialdehyde dehydrogenase
VSDLSATPLPTLRVAILGATGAVGEELLRGIEERALPVGELRLYASSRSAGERLTCQGKSVRVEDVDKAIARGLPPLDLAFFSAGAAASRTYASAFMAAGATVIDNTSAFRMQPAVPLVVPEVNAGALEGHAGLISNPNCSTIQLMSPLKALHELAGLSRVVVSTYQSASGAGRQAMDELRDQTVSILNFKDPPIKRFSRRLAFDLIPQIGDLKDDGETTEEEKMVRESRKILSLPDLAVSATCVRVPTFIGHCASVNAEFERPFELEGALEVLAEAEGVVLCEPHELPTTADVVGQDEVWVGRVRRDPSRPNALNLWIAADNLRKGAATNALQIAEALMERGWLAASARR